MNPWISIEDIIQATSGKVISVSAKQFDTVGTDTRKSLHGQLFVALKGETFDAHSFLEKAVEAGAAGLLIHQIPEVSNLESKQKFDALKMKATIILVEDTLLALQKLGQLRRRQWGKPIIAITGSNGKTTTKEFTAQIISTYKKTHYNQGSFNNHWGLPLTLLGLMPDHEIAICEMGMNHAGEISALVKLAEPNIVGVTMVGRAHLEGLGSIQAVAKAKEEIYESPTSLIQQTRIFNLDNEWTHSMYQKLSSDQRTTFLTYSSLQSEANVHFKINHMTLDHLEISGTIKGVQGTVQIPVFGKQNKDNLMFAACAALATGLTPNEIWKALPRCKTIWGRNQKISHPSGAEILFDGYNANPDSQKALIENLKLLHTEKPLVGIFGEMRELGAHSEKLHEELGSLVATAPFSKVFFVGNFGEHFKEGFLKESKNDTSFSSSKLDSIFIYKDIDTDFINKIKLLLPQKPIITIKGSRGVKLERILEHLT